MDGKPTTTRGLIVFASIIVALLLTVASIAIISEGGLAKQPAPPCESGKRMQGKYAVIRYVNCSDWKDDAPCKSGCRCDARCKCKARHGG